MKISAYSGGIIILSMTHNEYDIADEEVVSIHRLHLSTPETLLNLSLLALHRANAIEAKILPATLRPLFGSEPV